MDNHKNHPNNNRSLSNVGGAANWAGAVFETRAVVFHIIEMLSLQPLSNQVSLREIHLQAALPVDDFVIVDDAGGRRMYQAKKHVTPSDRKESDFGKAFQEFCVAFTSQNNPFKEGQDRLILVTVISSPQNIHKFAEWLKTVQSQNSYENFQSNALQHEYQQEFWRKVQAVAVSADGDSLSKEMCFRLLQSVEVEFLDPENIHEKTCIERLQNRVIHNPDKALSALDALVALVVEMAPHHGVIDRRRIREHFHRRGIQLRDDPIFETDLQQLAEKTERALCKIESRIGEHWQPRCVFKDDGTEVKNILTPETQQSFEGHLLIKGEAGVGKSALLKEMALQMQKVGNGVRVIVLLGEESVGPNYDLRNLLDLEHPLLDVLEAAMRGGNVFLYVDSLDTISRNREIERVYRDLLLKAYDFPNLTIVASIREFDWAYSQEWKKIPWKIISLPPFSQEDVSQIEAHFQTKNSEFKIPDNLRELVRNPFRFRLLSEILKYDLHADLSEVQTEIDLFNYFWQVRLKEPEYKDNIPREEIAHKITRAMLNKGRLEIGKGELPIQSLKSLLSDGILQERGLPKRQPPNQRLSGDRITYFHHLFFDYAVCRFIAQEQSDISICDYILKDPHNLFLRPTLRLLFQYLYERATERFFNEVKNVLYSNDIPEFWKTVVTTTLAENCQTTEDFQYLTKLIEHFPQAEVETV